MSFIGGLFSSSNGSRFRGTGVPIASGTDAADAEKANWQALNGVYGQRDMANQYNKFNLPGQLQTAGNMQNELLRQMQYGGNSGQGAQGAAGQSMQNLLSAMGGVNGVQNQQNVFNQAQGLADQLGAQARGEGPNPAQAALNQATGQNTANQAALMASQRGSNANPALLARQAAQQGAANQQQAAGQSATLQAQQQIAAQQALANQQQLMGGLAQQQIANQQGQQQALGNFGLNQTNQLQGQQNAFNQQLADRARLGQGATNAYAGSALGYQQNINNALSDYNRYNVGMQSNLNDVNASIARGNQQAQSDALGGLFGGVGALLMNKGGMVEPVHKYAMGGGPGFGAPTLGADVQLPQPAVPSVGGAPNSYGGGALGQNQQPSGPMSRVGKFLYESGRGQSQAGQPQGGLRGGMAKLGQGLGGAMGRAFKSPEQKAPEQSDFSNSLMDNQKSYQLPMAAKGGLIDAVNMKFGGKVAGTAKVSGDSTKNDTVPAMLSPKEIVLPRTVTMSENAPEKAAQFVAAILSREKLKK